MSIQRVTDKGSNAEENIERAVKVIGRSQVRLKVFMAIHTGRRQAKTVDELADETGIPRQQVLNATGILARQGIVHQDSRGRSALYRRDQFYQVNRDAVFRFVKNPRALAALPTKRRPVGTKGMTVLQIPVVRGRMRARSVTIDDMDSFAKTRGVTPGKSVKLSEKKVKQGLLCILRDRGKFNDWGGEQNDFLTDKLVIAGARRVGAFALKGPGKKGTLTPAKMGKNGDQIQRLAGSAAQVLVVQYHGAVAESVREQLENFSQLKSVQQERQIYYCVIDGDDTSRLVAAYPKEFGL